MEELSGQLAESLPGAVSLFAEAYQRQTGGSLTGTESIQALQAAMKKRLVRGDILNTAATIASERAAPSLAISARTSQSEQARFQNTTNDLVRLANQSGVEDGYARLFKTLNDGLQESGPLVRALSQGFDALTEKVRVMLLIPQSFQRLLQGRDSFIADFIGLDRAEEVRKLFGDLEVFGKNFSELTTTIGNGWKLIFGQMKEIDGLTITKVMAQQLGIANETIKAVNSAANGDTESASGFLDNARKSYFRTITRPARGLLDPLIGQVTGTENPVTNFLGLGEDPKAPGGTALNRTQFPGITPINNYAVGVPAYQNPMMPYVPPTDPTLMQNQLQKDVNQNTTNNNDNRVNVTVGDITVQTSATDAQGISTDIGQQLRDALNNTFSDARIQYPSIGR